MFRRRAALSCENVKVRVSKLLSAKNEWKKEENERKLNMVQEQKLTKKSPGLKIRQFMERMDRQEQQNPTETIC